MAERYSGYKGKALQSLMKFETGIGDLVEITKDGSRFRGILMPRSELGNKECITIKLRSGYNIGIRVNDSLEIRRIKGSSKPTFTRLSPPPQTTGLPKIVIISTGGTIASRVDYRTGAVRPAISAGDLYSIVPELSNIASIDTRILFSKFSEDLTSKHWTKLAKEIEKEIKSGIQGIIITHGTDTLGYTAAALSFALQNLPVPVVLVGAQRSEDRPSSDAATNLIGAVVSAAYGPFAEVVVAMHRNLSDEVVVLHRGTKVRKLHTSRRDAFVTVNDKPMAEIYNEELVMLTDNYRRRDTSKPLEVKSKFEENVALVKFHPNFNPEIIDWYNKNGYKGIIIEGTGLGHVSRKCIPQVKKAIDDGLIIAMTSQCVWGRVNMNVYTNGRDLLKMGVVPLEDMLSETALVKLKWVLGQTSDIDFAKETIRKNICHEISRRTVEYFSKKRSELVGGQ